LRAAAGPKTQLVICELHVAYACDDPATHEIPGAELPVPPYPLLPNLGRAGSLPYTFDAQMLVFFNGQERTLMALRSLFDKAGWDIIAVHHETPAVVRFQKVVAVPK